MIINLMAYIFHPVTQTNEGSEKSQSQTGLSKEGLTLVSNSSGTLENIYCKKMLSDETLTYLRYIKLCASYLESGCSG